MFYPAKFSSGVTKQMTQHNDYKLIKNHLLILTVVAAQIAMCTRKIE